MSNRTCRSSCKRQTAKGSSQDSMCMCHHAVAKRLDEQLVFQKSKADNTRIKRHEDDV